MEIKTARSIIIIRDSQPTLTIIGSQMLDDEYLAIFENVYGPIFKKGSLEEILNDMKFDQVSFIKSLLTYKTTV